MRAFLVGAVLLMTALCVGGCAADDAAADGGSMDGAVSADDGVTGADVSVDAGVEPDARIEGDSAVRGGEPWVQIGQGEDVFSALAEGDEVFVILGPQGGYHVLGSVQAGGFDTGNPDDLQDPRNPVTAFAVYLGERRVDADVASFRQALKPAFGLEDTYEMVGRFVILDIADDDELVGETLDLRVEITDSDGVVYRDSRSVIAVKHPNNDLPP